MLHCLLLLLLLLLLLHEQLSNPVDQGVVGLCAEVLVEYLPGAVGLDQNVGPSSAA